MNWTPLTTPKLDLLVRYRTAPEIYKCCRYGRICDLTPDGRWIKVKPNHSLAHRRWVPREWVWEMEKAE